MRVPLYLKTVSWLLLTLAVLVVAGTWFVKAQLNVTLGDLISGAASGQVQPLARLVESELHKLPPKQWQEVLRHFDDAYSVRMAIFRPDGRPVVSEIEMLPPDILRRFPRLGGNLPGTRPPPGRGEPQPREAAPPSPILHSTSPEAYWALIPIELPPFAPGQPKPRAILAIRSETPSAGGLFFNIRPWLLGGLGLVILSALLWIPFVSGITRAVSQMKSVTRRMAEGKFDVQVRNLRNDELGELGGSINRMAGQLGGYISGQKRFIGAIAHELCAPLARMQLALGILEQGNAEDESIKDLREEADHMNDLVSEALAFSRASRAPAVRKTAVNIAELAACVARRESPPDRHIELSIDAHLLALADEHLLERALGNVIRNAIRYSPGVVRVSAAHVDSGIVLAVSDNGPGIPDAELEKIFEPFYRLDPSRSTDTGGSGLGLAIVRTCMESTGGSVECRNLHPGFQVTLRLSPA